MIKETQGADCRRCRSVEFLEGLKIATGKEGIHEIVKLANATQLLL